MPIEAGYSSAVRWQIPDNYDKIARGTTGRSFVVEADGVIAECRDWSMHEIAPGYASQCNGAEYYVPFRDRKGKPVRRNVTITTQTSATDAE